MKCTKCGSDVGSRVIRTEACSDGVIRTRVCFSCHVSFDTMETACDEFAVEVKPKKRVAKTA